MSRHGVWMHVTVVGSLRAGPPVPVETPVRHFIVHAATDDEALAVFEKETGSEAEYWVSYRTRDEIMRWLDGAEVAGEFEA